jgi:Fur family ferric uptake transcriptional regulator
VAGAGEVAGTAASQDPATVLRAAGLRATGPRLGVLRTLGQRHHATAEEIAVEVSSQGVAQSTVYRTLEHLERAGLVEQVSLTPGRRTYHRTSTAAHLHLRCTVCGDLQQADVRVLRRLARTLEETAGFVLDTAHPVLTGVCARCRPEGG